MEFLRQLINGLCGKIRLKLNKKNHIKKWCLVKAFVIMLKFKHLKYNVENTGWLSTAITLPLFALLHKYYMGKVSFYFINSLLNPVTVVMYTCS